MSQRGRNQRAACDAMDVDNAEGASDRQSGPRANRDGRARRDNPPTTSGRAPNAQKTSDEDAETKKLFEEFRALVPPTLWERVQTTARAYYSKIFRVENASYVSDA